MNRNDVFLDAMGLGPQWRLRNAPGAMDGAAMADADAVAGIAGTAGDFAEADAAAYPGGAGPRAAHSAPAAGHAVHAEPVMAAPAADAVAAPDAAPVAPAAPAGAATQHGAASIPAAVPPAARPAPASGEDTSWFDDAPAAPSTRPALKSPPPAKAPPPVRPAQNAQAGQAPEAGSESYAWFDDVPATPIAKSVRKSAPGADAEDDAPSGPVGRPVPQANPARPLQAAPPAQQAMPEDGIPWFDDAPLPSFDAAFDDAYGDAESDAGITDAAIARMDRAAMEAAVQSCTRCALCRERSAAVPGRGPDRAPWLVLAAAPSGDDEAQIRPLAGAPGQLLDNMLKAIKVAPEAEAYVTTLVKCRPQGDRAPTADEVAACRPYLERELALAGSRAVITLGHAAAKGLLGAAARGKVLRLERIPVVATYHPADLLRKPDDKARAWADLCLARSAFDGRA